MSLVFVLNTFRCLFFTCRQKIELFCTCIFSSKIMNFLLFNIIYLVFIIRGPKITEITNILEIFANFVLVICEPKKYEFPVCYKSNDNKKSFPLFWTCHYKFPIFDKEFKQFSQYLKKLLSNKILRLNI